MLDYIVVRLLHPDKRPDDCDIIIMGQVIVTAITNDDDDDSGG